MGPTKRCPQDATEQTGGTRGPISSKGCKEGVVEECMAQHQATYGHAAPLWDVQLAWYQHAVLWVLRQGALPRHVTIAPDGNRRFAKTTGIELRSSYGILFRNLVLVCHCMAVLGVTKVTAILFATRNFVRDASDVDAIFDVITRFCARTLHSLHLLQPLGVRMCVGGDLGLLPKELQVKMSQVEVANSSGSGETTCQLCVASSSKLDMRPMAQNLAKALESGSLEAEDITPELIEDYLELCEGPETELWYRGAGEQRFSELFTQQSGYAYMHIDPKLWPSVQFWDWVRAVLYFQLHWPKIKAVKERHRSIQKSGNNRLCPIEVRIRQRTFLRQVEAMRTAYIQAHCSAF